MVSNIHNNCYMLPVCPDIQQSVEDAMACFAHFRTKHGMQIELLAGNMDTDGEEWHSFCKLVRPYSYSALVSNNALSLFYNFLFSLNHIISTVHLCNV